MTSSRRAVVAGGTGFIGRALCGRLVEDQFEVVVLSRNPDKAESVLDERVTVARWDARSSDGWERYVDGAHAVVNLAAENIVATGAALRFTPDLWRDGR